MTSLQEPVNSQLDALTGKHFLISVTERAERHIKERVSDANVKKNSFTQSPLSWVYLSQMKQI